MRAAVVDGVHPAIDVEQRDVATVGLHTRAFADTRIGRDRQFQGVVHDEVSQRVRMLRRLSLRVIAPASGTGLRTDALKILLVVAHAHHQDQRGGNASQWQQLQR
ncbi:hypothetical protein D3C80_1321710 [compost metagenome]